jgi:hypothetical protein
MSAAKTKTVILRARADMTIRIATTAANSIAVIPLGRFLSNLRLAGILFGEFNT